MFFMMLNLDKSASTDQSYTPVNTLAHATSQQGIKNKSEETLTMEEGCLSAPGKVGKVKRHLRITVNYWCKWQEEHEKTFYDLHAQVIQHELDHMDGKLCIDYNKN